MGKFKWKKTGSLSGDLVDLAFFFFFWVVKKNPIKITIASAVSLGAIITGLFVHEVR